ncbi:MAG: hypothetical protein HY747_10430 [Elusimicrobia bacterium]|nr:hypothetical protein [Elusimicrobiota bacterium]
MTKIFLATPITPLLGSNLKFKACAKKKVKRILDDLRTRLNAKVFCAIEREKWGDAALDGLGCTAPDFHELKNSDIVVAFPSSSYGVHVELGWASALKKPIIVCLSTQRGFDSPLAEGLETLTRCSYIRYKSTDVFPDKTTWNVAVRPRISEELRLLLSSAPSPSNGIRPFILKHSPIFGQFFSDLKVSFCFCPVT